MRKHTYTNDTAPLNTGSVIRPARYNMRQTCSVHARTIHAFRKVRENTGMPKDASFADVWERKILPAIEHIEWHRRNSPSTVGKMVTSLYDPIPKEDYVRARFERDRQRLARSRKTLSGKGKRK